MRCRRRLVTDPNRTPIRYECGPVGIASGTAGPGDHADPPLVDLRARPWGLVQPSPTSVHPQPPAYSLLRSSLGTAVERNLISAADPTKVCGGGPSDRVEGRLLRLAVGVLDSSRMGIPFAAARFADLWAGRGRLH